MNYSVNMFLRSKWNRTASIFLSSICRVTMLLDLVQTTMTLSYDIKGPQGYLINIELDTVQTNQFTTDFYKTHYPIHIGCPIATLWQAMKCRLTRTHLPVDEHVCAVSIFFGVTLTLLACCLKGRQMSTSTPFLTHRYMFSNWVHMYHILNAWPQINTWSQISTRVN